MHSNKFTTADNQPPASYTYGKKPNYSFGTQNNLHGITAEFYSQNPSKKGSSPGLVNPPASTFKKTRDAAPTVTSHNPLSAKTQLDLQKGNLFGKNKTQNIYKWDTKPNPLSKSGVSEEDSSDNLTPNSRQNAYPTSRGYNHNNTQAKVQSRETSAAHLRQKYSIPSAQNFDNAFKPSINNIKIKDRPETAENTPESPSFAQPSSAHKPRGHQGAQNYVQKHGVTPQEPNASAPNLQKPPPSAPSPTHPKPTITAPKPSSNASTGTIMQNEVQTINALKKSTEWDRSHAKTNDNTYSGTTTYGDKSNTYQNPGGVKSPLNKGYGGNTFDSKSTTVGDPGSKDAMPTVGTFYFGRDNKLLFVVEKKEYDDLKAWLKSQEDKLKGKDDELKVKTDLIEKIKLKSGVMSKENETLKYE
jgi:hypothetical protein